MVVGGFGGKKSWGIGNVVGCSVVFVEEFIDPCTTMFVGVAGLKKMILPICMGDWILGDIIHWEMIMFYFFSKGENIVIRGIEVSDGVEGIKVREEEDCIMKI